MNRTLVIPAGEIAFVLFPGRGAALPVPIAIIPVASPAGRAAPRPRPLRRGSGR